MTNGKALLPRIFNTCAVLANLFFGGCLQGPVTLTLSDRSPPYLWSLSTFRDGSVVLAIPHNGTFELVRIDVESGASCLLVESADADEFLPSYDVTEDVLSFVRLNIGSSDMELRLLNSKSKVDTIVPMQERFQIGSVAFVSPEMLFFTGTKNKRLATEEELYRAVRKEGRFLIERMTNNDQVDSGVFCSLATGKVYWNQSGNGDDTNILVANFDFKTMTVVGRGPLMDYSMDQHLFLKSGGGTGRFGTIELWDPKSGQSTTVASSRDIYFIDACFTLDGKHVCTLSNDGDWNMMIHRIPIDGNAKEMELIATFRRVKGSHWEPIREGVP
jgi:hypothetical protein